LDPQDIARHLLDTLGYCPAVLCSERYSSQDKQIEGSLREINALDRQPVPFHFYKTL
jgi:hypothetical protein